MRARLLVAATTLLGACTFADGQVRKLAATDFACPEDEIVVHQMPSGYLARGCRKEAQYAVLRGQPARSSDVGPAAVYERPELPIDRIPGTNSIGVR